MRRGCTLVLFIIHGMMYGALTVPNLIHTNTNLQHTHSPQFRRRSVPFGRRSREPFRRPLHVYHNSEGGPYHSEGDLGNHSVGYCTFTTIPRAFRTIRKAVSTTAPKGIDTMYHSEGCLSNFSGRLVACTS